MRKADADRVLGALLGGAATPPRRRRTTTRSSANPLSLPRGTASAIGALATLATTVLGGVLSGRSEPAPSRSRRTPDIAASPWGTPPTAPPADSGWGATPPRAPTWSPPPAAAPDAEEQEALLLVRAAIAAAKADGALQPDERQHIMASLDSAGLDAEARDFVLRDLERPITQEEIARSVRDPMLAAQVYAAAVAAAGEVSAPERAWLDELARRLRLDRAAAAAIEERVGG